MAEVNFNLLNTQLPGQIANIAGNAAQEGRANAMQMIQLQHGLAQNRLADLTYGEQLRQIEEQKQIKNALAGADISTPEGQIAAIRRATQINPKMGFDLQKQFEEAEKRRVEMAKLRAETDKIAFEKGLKNREQFFQTLRQASTNPTDEAVQAAFSHAVSLGVPMQEITQDQARILAMPPEQRAQTLAAYGAAAKDMMDRVAPKVERFTTPGGGLDFMQMNPNLPSFGKRPEGLAFMPAQMTPYETQRLNFDRAKFNWEKEHPGMEIKETDAGLVAVNKQSGKATPVTLNGESVGPRATFNQDAGGFVTPPSASNPQGKFTPLPEIQRSKDQIAAIQALKTAGFDAQSGKDEMADMIKKSTGGLIPNYYANVAGAFNYTTEGKALIGRIATRANKIVTDMLGGKLGTGISNEDRNLIQASAGDLANPNLPVGQRLAAWDELKKRLIDATANASPTDNAPKVGQVTDGYKFKGGDPADPKNWEKQ